MTSAEASDPKPARVLMAWGVHLFTASGGVIAALALFATVGGHLAAAALLMLAALLIDSVDGALARRVGVADAVPRVDGRRLDDIVDFANYAIVPTVFMLATGALPHWTLAALPMLASAYGFSQRDAKTEDDFFLGWPSYWNVVAIYAWLLDVRPATATAFVVAFSLAIFVPLKYVYPSKLAVWRGPTIACACVWGALLVAAIVSGGESREWQLPLTWLSLFFPIYYLGLSAWLGGWIHRRT